ncbi:MAG: hypothetical protein EYC62_04890 [Alphaproteobacteria bacterium]|nr:MAG: hypothetical protein EYC62_04890 [Alphaproteobacteria bacterium]
MSDSVSSASKNSAKPPLLRRLFALFLVILFAGIGGSIVLYAKKTGYDGLLSSSAPAVAEMDVKQTAKQAPATKPLPDTENNEMVVVDDSIAKQTGMSDSTANTDDSGMAGRGDSPDVENLKQQLKNMENDLAQKDNYTKSSAEMTGTISSLQKEVSSLTEKVNQLEQLTVQLQKSNQRGVQNDVTLLLAVNNLQMAMASGRPFAQSIDMLRKLADGNAEMEKIINSLRGVAENGIVDLPSLQAEFSKVAHSLMQAQAQQNAADWAAGWAGEGMIASTIGKIASLVTVRRTGEETGNDLEANINSIETDLSQNQLQGALKTVKSLPASVHTEELDEWQFKLSERNTADMALAELQKMILTRLQSNTTVN